MNTVVIIGSGFDIDLGLENSCSDFSKNRLCPTIGHEKWSDFENTLREEIIDWYEIGKDEQISKKLNLLWQTYVKNISWFFTEKSDNFSKNKKCQKGRKCKKTKNTCAYKFLKKLKKGSGCKIYTFNYTNPYEYVDILQTKVFTHLHGKHHIDTFDKDLLVMSQGHNIIFGIDECIPKDGINHPNIYPLVKKHHPTYKQTNLIADLSKAEKVIFYGFSMGKIDYCYFLEFFNSISDACSRCKDIYYVTYNKKGFDAFLQNLENNNLNTENILRKINIKPIYTRKGFKNRDFRMMLRFL